MMDFGLFALRAALDGRRMTFHTHPGKKPSALVGVSFGNYFHEPGSGWNRGYPTSYDSSLHPT